MPVSVFRHSPAEHLGTIAGALDAAGIAFDYTDQLDDGASGLIVLGGEMSANDDLPNLRAEERAILRAVDRGIPVLGICLGAQLIARALGARVYKNPFEEFGWSPVWLTDDAGRDPLFTGLPSPLTMLHWHAETFDLPPGAVHLAWSDRCRHQAFRAGSNVYGIQFHPEVSPEMIAEWTPLIDPHSHSMTEFSGPIFSRWCGLLKDPIR